MKTDRYKTKGDMCQVEQDAFDSNCPEETVADCDQLLADFEACKKTDRFFTKGDACAAELNIFYDNGCVMPCTEGTITNQLVCPDGRTVYRRFRCGIGWEDVMPEEDCPGWEEQVCDDPDNSDPDNLGEDRLIRSVTSGRFMGVYQTQPDGCTQPGQLIEYYCDADGVTMRNRAHDCPEGEVCPEEEGACVVQAEPPPEEPPPAEDDRTCPDQIRCAVGNICHEGRCIPPPVLNSCGEPEGGWQAGVRYILEEDLPANMQGLLSSCFDLRNQHDITIDCQGHLISTHEYTPNHYDRGGQGTGTGFSLINSNNITIKNCHIGGFLIGIGVGAGDSNTLRDNILESCHWAISLTAPNEGHTLRINNNHMHHNINGLIFTSFGDIISGRPEQNSETIVSGNRSCDNSYNLTCAGYSGSSVTGSGNIFTPVQEMLDLCRNEDEVTYVGWPGDGDYSPCQ